jgi:hypothetical protein
VSDVNLRAAIREVANHCGCNGDNASVLLCDTLHRIADRADQLDEQEEARHDAIRNEIGDTTL